MPDVIVSYMREDEVAVHAIAQNLDANGIRYWIDQKSTPAGEAWRPEFPANLSTARACWVFFSKAVRARPTRVFFDEQKAIEQEKLRRPDLVVIPFLLDDVTVQDACRLSGSTLSDVHFLKLGGSDALGELRRAFSRIGVVDPRIPHGPDASLLVKFFGMPRWMGDEVPGRLHLGNKSVRVKTPANVVGVPVGQHKLILKMSKYGGSDGIGGIAPSSNIYIYGKTTEREVEIRPFDRYILHCDVSNTAHRSTIDGMGPALWYLARRAFGPVVLESEKAENERYWPPLNSTLSSVSHRDFEFESRLAQTVQWE